MHLRGKCKLSGKDCTRKHNPPCRFFARGACASGKDCSFPHHQPLAAVTTQEEGAEVNERGRSRDRDRNKKKGGARSQTPGVATVCLLRSGVAIVLRPGNNGLAAATVVGGRERLARSTSRSSSSDRRLLSSSLCLEPRLRPEATSSERLRSSPALCRVTMA